MFPERLGLLYLKSGGGHLSAARTIERAFAAVKTRKTHNGREIEKPGLKRAPHGIESVFTFNPVPDTKKITSYLLGKGYRIASFKLPGLWIFLYDISRLHFVQTLWNYITYFVIRKQLKFFIINNGITKIGVLHFLLIRPVVRVLRDLNLSLPVCTIVTDPFTAHPMWFSPGKRHTVVFSESLKNRAVTKYGMDPERVRVFSPLIAGGYEKPPSKDEISAFKKRHGFNPELPLVLFAGGGEGAPRAAAFLRNWLKTLPAAGLAIVCGMDAELKADLERIVRRKEAENSGIRIFAFIDFMPQLMGSADVVAAKAGPATVLEAMSMGKLLFIYSYIYGQEKGNVSFAVRQGAGFYVPKMKELVRRISEIVSGAGDRSGSGAKRKLPGLSSGTADICRFLAEFR